MKDGQPLSLYCNDKKFLPLPLSKFQQNNAKSFCSYCFLTFSTHKKFSQIALIKVSVNTLAVLVTINTIKLKLPAQQSRFIIVTRKKHSFSSY